MKKQYTTVQGTFVADTDKQKKTAHYLAIGKNPQEEEVLLIRRYIDSGSTFIDVGANIGTIAIPVAKTVHKVIAFEPVKENYELLEENIRLNRLTNIEVHTVALGKERGTINLVAQDDKDASTYSVREGGDISVIQLDSILTSADFIKIDVEGYELEVLQGAKETLRQSKPSILFEVNLIELRKRGDWWLRQVGRELSQEDYRLYMPHKDGSLERVRSVAWTMFKLAPKAFLTGKLHYTINLLALPA